MINPDEIRFIGAALSPALVVLFALEMSCCEQLYRKGILSEKAMSVRTAISMAKLPAGMLLPLFLGAPGACLLAVSILYTIRTLLHGYRRHGRNAGQGGADRHA